MPWEQRRKGKKKKQLQPAVLEKWSGMFEVLQSFHGVMRNSLLYAECSLCGGFVKVKVCVRRAFVVYKPVESHFFQTPINNEQVAAGSTLPLRLCLLNNVPSRLIINNISIATLLFASLSFTLQ